jgi:hypothetical protein
VNDTDRDALAAIPAFLDRRKPVEAPEEKSETADLKK